MHANPTANVMADPPVPTAPAMNPRTRGLLEDRLLPLLLRLAVPNMAMMLAQSAAGLIEAYFIGQLGTDALAGVSVVFPGLMLMTMMSAGAMGGGIAASVARALGRRDRAMADALVIHAVIINLVFGLAFAAGMLLAGPWLYRTLGVRGASLDAALTYSNIVFGAAPVLWVFNALGSVIRGTGNITLPSQVICGGVVLLLVLSPCLIFGLGPFPALGVAGGGVAWLLYSLIGALVFLWYLLSGRGVVQLRWSKPRWALFRDILRVGAVAILVTLQTYLTISFATAQVGHVSPEAVAGFGTGNRLEYLLVPLVFGVGGPMVAIVGTCVGAGLRARALRAAWLGAAVSLVICETIGLAASVWPTAWLGLFGTDPAMLVAGSTYLRIVGPFYGLFGFGMALYFASQGAGRLLWPLLAGGARLVVGVGGGAAALALGYGLPGLFLALGLALSVFGVINAAAVASGAWFRAR
jgi:putative MATE family efflux protein